MRCLALFTGGLDSQIAVRLMQQQAIEVVGLFVQTPFTPAFAAAAEAAERLQMELRRCDWEQDYLQLLQRPRFGFAEAMAPCLDCRIGMVSRAREWMTPLGASFLISGEVVGQRPSSLRSRDLETIAVHGGADDLLLRPLSAQLLPPTLPERNGWVDRGRLLGWHGRGRREQLALAREWDLVEPVEHAPGCLLLEPTYASRLKRVLAQTPEPAAWHLQLLTCGRHFWNSGGTHLVIAKNRNESVTLQMTYTARQQGVLLEPVDFRGPTGLCLGAIDEGTLLAAAQLLASYGKGAIGGQSRLSITGWTQATLTVPQPNPGSESNGFCGL